MGRAEVGGRDVITAVIISVANREGDGRLADTQIRGANLALKVDLGEGMPQLLGHKGKLQQVLLNLLINSRDAIGDSGTISLATKSENGKIRLEIVDDDALDGIW